MNFKKTVVAALVATLVGCSAFIAPTTPRQTLATMEIGYTAALETAGTFVDSGVIPDAKKPELIADIVAVQAALNAADAAIMANNSAITVGALQTAQAALNTLTLYLKEAQNGASPSSH